MIASVYDAILCVWRHRDVIASTSSERGNSESLIACSYKVFVYRRLFSNSLVAVYG